MKRNKVICELCGLEISLSNISKHKNSKVCLKVQQGKTLKRNIEIPKDLKCSFCGKQYENKNSFINHERCCKHNPNKQLTNFSDLEKNKLLKKSNQFIKAKEEGREIKVSNDVRKKHSAAAKRNKEFSFSSKECNNFIKKLLEDLPELTKYTLYFHNHPHEFVLNSNGKKYCYDFTIKELRLIIEYNGIKFHPKSIDDVNFKPIFKSQGTTKDNWIKDQFKLNLAKENGFDVLTCWNDNLEDGIKQIKDYLYIKVGI